MRYIISGGGTGGHIYPALAIANEIKRLDKDADILYVGTKNGLESELVPKAGFNFKTVRVMGLPRKVNKEFFVAIKELILGLKDANSIVRNFKPDIVIGTGGYVSGPVVLMGKINRTKTFIHEQNAYPGITNKILGRLVDKICVTFEEAISYFKKKDRVVVTGNPVRKEIINIDREKALELFDIKNNKPIILSFGGSGGQLKLNNAILDIILEKDIEDYNLIHVTGRRLYDDFIKKLGDRKNSLKENIKILPYLYEMPEGLNIADIVIASSGAITLAEISALGKPSILVPKSYTAENHQVYNAKAFEKAGASKVILETDVTGKKLEETINQMLSNKEELEKMKVKSKSLGNIEATTEIANLILDIVK